jgi:hypothetical protein
MVFLLLKRVAGMEGLDQKVRTLGGTLSTVKGVSFTGL